MHTNHTQLCLLVLFERSLSTYSALQIVRKNSLSTIISFNEFYPETKIHKSALQIVRNNSLSAIISFSEIYPETEIHNNALSELYHNLSQQLEGLEPQVTSPGLGSTLR